MEPREGSHRLDGRHVAIPGEAARAIRREVKEEPAAVDLLHPGVKKESGEKDKKSKKGQKDGKKRPGRCPLCSDEPADLSHHLEAPPGGSACGVVLFPWRSWWLTDAPAPKDCLWYWTIRFVTNKRLTPQRSVS
jgi:hypothetical protein